MISQYQTEYNLTQSPHQNTRHVLAKRATFPEYLDHHQDLSREQPASVVKRSAGVAADKYLETALFMDSEAYKMYKEYFSGVGYSNPDQRIIHLLLAFMNSIQAIYNFDSLGTKVDFSLVNLEIHKTAQFDDKGGDRAPMLTSFCKYQAECGTALVRDYDRAGTETIYYDAIKTQRKTTNTPRKKEALIALSCVFMA